MKVLVTGGTGFVGSWLVKRLVQEGLDVRCLHRSSRDLDDLAGVKFESSLGDITDFASVQKACKGVDTVFHLAGVVGYSRQMRELMDKVNIGGTENILKASSENGVRRFLHMSSVVAIGASYTPTPLNENSSYTLGNLNLGYFESKKRAEELVKAFVLNRKLDAVIVNPSTVYGPGDAKKGSRKIQIKVAQGKFPIYPTGGASIVSVHDVIEGILKSWQKGRTGERYILSGENLLVRDLFRKIAQLGGVNPPRVPLPRPIALGLGRIGDVLESIGKKTPINTENAWVSSLYHWFDSSKAKVELGFSARNADEALAESVAWMKTNKLI